MEGAGEKADPGKGQQVFFAKGATRWLVIWLDSALTLVENRRRCVNRAKLRLGYKGWPTSLGFCRPRRGTSCRQPLFKQPCSTPQSRRGEGIRTKAMERECQRAINRVKSNTTGTFQSAPLGIVMAERNLAAVNPQLD